MPIMFNSILTAHGIDSRVVRHLRHQARSERGALSPYRLWRDDRTTFELYQSLQRPARRAELQPAVYFATWLVPSPGATLFGGLYHAHWIGPTTVDVALPGRTIEAGSYDRYECTRHREMEDLIGRLLIDWGPGLRSWIQRADLQDKPVVELRATFEEDPFPGYVAFIEPLSRLETLPRGWEAALRSARGVYLLTCPQTREQYVGSATGAAGFWGRWLDYLQDGHGGNISLRSRDPSDYQVSILEVAGSAMTTEDILRAEARWKQKLQSREMGLNRN